MRFILLFLVSSFVLHGQVRHKAKSVVEPSGSGAAGAPKAWAAEPTSFFGIQFDKPVAASLPECEKEPGLYIVPRYNTTPGGSECFEATVPLYEIANVNMFYPVYVDVVSSNVGEISSTIKAAYVERDYAALVTRFGPPTKEQTEDVKSRSGVAYKNRISLWQGTDIEILFETVGSRVDEGFLSVTSKAYRLAHAKQDVLDVKKAADTF